MSSNESMDDEFDYYHYYESGSDNYEDFIDDNNYTFSDTDSNHSIEIIDDINVNEMMENIDEDIDEDIVDDINGAINEDINEDINETINEVVSEGVNDLIQLKTEEIESKPVFKDMNRSVMSSTQDNYDNCCIICTEMWTTGGGHQLVSLSCGHLFGRSCIERWLNAKTNQNQRCPQCNKKAKKRDIRVIYARNLRVLDTSEKDRAVEELQKERNYRKKLEFEAIESSTKMQTILKENERLKREYIECQERLKALQHLKQFDSKKNIKSMKTVICFEIVKEMDINYLGECRHLGFSNLFEVIVVSQPNQNLQLFPGYGVKKVYLNDFKTDNICIHSKKIKDLEINAYDGTVLTTSLDKTVKLTSLLNKSSIMSYDLDVEAWSVTFNPKNKYEFYAGLRTGQILLFDTRMMSRYVDQLEPSVNSPIVSLNYIEFESSIGRVNGILSTQIHNFSFYERNNSSDSITSSNFSMIKIPFEGRFNPSHIENKLGLVLLSCRPSSIHRNTSHYVLDLKMNFNDNNEHIIVPEVVASFDGGSKQVQLSRSQLLANPYNVNSPLICAGDESAEGALIWDMNSNKCLQTLKTKSPVLDFSLLNNFNTREYYMTALTATSLHFYRYNNIF